jgi:hypothetical protein
MSSLPGEKHDLKMLPGAPASAASQSAAPVVAASSPAVQLQNLPKDELKALAEQFGLDPSRYITPQHLVAALHERRQLISLMDRDAMLDVVKWARRPVPHNASREQIAQEIVRIKGMRFGGLSQRGLVVISRLRGIGATEREEIPVLVKRLKKQEGFFSRMNRKRRALLGSMVANMLGDEEQSSEYQFTPPQDEGSSATSTVVPRQTSIKEEIEEQGLFGGLAGRIKKSADSYVNTKLDEIEARIDRKLDEIDRRLAEWRDKELANRLRILKITLWASVIVGIVSLLYSYIRYIFSA